MVAQRVRALTGHPVAAICRTVRMARQTAYHVVRPRPPGAYDRADDATVLQQIRAVTNSRATYGYRRIWAMVNRQYRTGYNRKRIRRRLMRRHGLMLAPRVPRRHGRPHPRWCSDIFLIPCWSGEVVSVLFAIDCHDREVPAWVASPRPLTGADVRTLMDRTTRPRRSSGPVLKRVQAPAKAAQPQIAQSGYETSAGIARPLPAKLRVKCLKMLGATLSA
jgi:hypothetical protein